MQSFLSQIKHTIELVSQSEFVLPASMVSDPNNSSIERPIAFFEYLFMRNGIAHLRKKFIPTEETNYYYDSIYDSKTETITEHDQDYETGEWRTFTYKFKDTLLKHLIKEFKLSKYYIDEHINLLKNESEIRLFLSLTLTSLKYLLSYIPKDADAKKYDSSPKPIIAIVDYCYSKYAIFCPPKDEVINAVLAGNGSIGIQQGIPETLNRSKPNGIRVFRLKSANIEGFALILHQHLKDGKLISADTDIEIFRKAFDGTSQQEPLKIKWLEKKTKIYPNKQTLFYLLNRLCDAKILEEEGDNNLLFKRINFVFSDFEGKPFKALKVSNNTASTKPPKRITKGKVIVENAIAALKAAGMSSIKP